MSDGENIKWKTMKSHPDLAVDSDKYFLHTKTPSAKKNRTPRMNELKEKIDERVESMKSKSMDGQTKKQKRSEKVSRNSNKKHKK